MSLTILESREGIQAAIVTMNPVAREAAQLLAHRLLESPDLFNDREKLGEEWVQACAISCIRSGIDPRKDQTRIMAFFDSHGSAVLNVAFSIALFIIKDTERQRKWGWLGQAAAVSAGVVIGSFFG
jgi:hypothetical protein